VFHQEEQGSTEVAGNGTIGRGLNGKREEKFKNPKNAEKST